jgi:hypothetical protein
MYLLAMSAQCRTVGCAVHKMQCASHGLWSVVCAVLYISCVVLQGTGGGVCESGVQEEVFGSEEREVTGDWRKLLN